MGRTQRLLRKAALTIARNLRLTDPALHRWVGDGDSHAGEKVTVNTALQLSTVWACVRLLSETIATLPLGIYERDDEGRKKPATRHPLYALLHDQPNADMTAVEFWEAMVACVLLWGNAYAEKAVIEGPGVRPRVIALTPLRPDLITVERTESGALVYRYRDADGRIRDIPEGRMFHIKGFSLDGMCGLSPIAQARHSLGLAMAAERTAGKLFANGMRNGGYLSAPTYLTREQRQQSEAMLDRFRGAQNAGKTPLLEGGWTFEALTLNPDDAQLLQTRAFSVEEIARIYRVPLHMIGHTEKVTSWGSGIESLGLGFAQYTLRPYLSRIEQTVKKSLLTPAERERYFAEFNIEGLLRADSQGRAALYSTFAQNGILTRNEIRALENRPPLPGGDRLTAQTNLAPLEQLGQQLQVQQGGNAPAEPPSDPAGKAGNWLELAQKHLISGQNS